MARDERVCKECNSGGAENVSHRLLKCPTWNFIRKPLTTVQTQY